LVYIRHRLHYPREEPQTHGIGVWVRLRTGWTFWGKKEKEEKKERKGKYQ